MTHRLVALVTLFGAAAIAVGVVACTGRSQTDGAKPAAGTGTWTAPRTPDGQPDLRGTWLNYETTPFEAPAAAEDTPADAEPAGRGGRGAAAGEAGTPIFGNGPRTARVPRRRSMVVDPPNGIVPVLPWAEQKRAYDLAHVNDSWEHLTTWERCISRGPGGRFPTNADSALRIEQIPGTVVMVAEILNEPRIIPLDGRAHLPSRIRLWGGDSRGHWEGNTLVVDVTNFNDKGSIATSASAQRIRGIPHSEALHVVERFTRASDNTINYEMTIEDPKVFSAPWKVAGPMTRDDTYRMFESACHEGNQRYIETTLNAGRLGKKTKTN